MAVYRWTSCGDAVDAGTPKINVNVRVDKCKIRWKHGPSRSSAGRAARRQPTGPARPTRGGDAIWAGAERGNHGDDAFARTGLLIGDAERCIEAALAYARVGVNQLLCHFPVVVGTHAAITDAVTRFGQDVIPAFA